MTSMSSQLSSINVKKNQQISELPSIGKEYDISFELLITNFGTDAFQNVIHFTLGENAAKYGDRNPAVWVTKQNKLCISSAISGNKNYFGPALEIPTVLETGKWIKIQISQTLVDGKVCKKYYHDHYNYHQHHHYCDNYNPIHIQPRLELDINWFKHQPIHHKLLIL